MMMPMVSLAQLTGVNVVTFNNSATPNDHVKNYTPVVINNGHDLLSVGSRIYPDHSGEVHFRHTNYGTTMVASQYFDRGSNLDEKPVAVLHFSDAVVYTVASCRKQNRDGFVVYESDVDGNITPGVSKLEFYDNTSSYMPFHALYKNGYIYVVGMRVNNGGFYFPNYPTWNSGKQSFIAKIDLNFNSPAQVRYWDSQIIPLTSQSKDFDMAIRVQNMPNGNLFIGGSANYAPPSGGSSVGGSMVIEVDDNLNTINQSCFVGSYQDGDYYQYATNIMPSTQGGYYVFGNTSIAYNQPNNAGLMTIPMFGLITKVLNNLDAQTIPNAINQFQFLSYDYEWINNLIKYDGDECTLTGLGTYSGAMWPPPNNQNLKPWTKVGNLTYNAGGIQFNLIRNNYIQSNHDMECTSGENIFSMGGSQSSMALAPPHSAHVPTPGGDPQSPEGIVIESDIAFDESICLFANRQCRTNIDGFVPDCPNVNATYDFEGTTDRARPAPILGSFTASIPIYHVGTQSIRDDASMLDCSIGDDFRMAGTESGNKKLPVDLVSIYPNPATDILHFTNGAATAVSLILTDVSGRHISEAKVAAGTTFDIMVPGIPSGIYFLQILGVDKNVHVKKVVINTGK